MKKQKTLLVLPKTENIGLSASPYLALPPLNLRIIEKLTQDFNPSLEVRIVDEFKESIERYVDDKDIGLVGITAMTPAAPRAYEISKMFRDRGVKTMLGGIHATVLPEEAMNHVDCVVTGEVESKWENILADYERGELAPRYDLGRLEDMSKVPKVSKAKGYMLPFTTQTKRGCPVGCDFCSVTAVNGKEVRHRPVDAVIDEIKLARRDGVKQVIFTDDNIFAPGKENPDHAIEFFKKLAQEDLGIMWGSQAGINLGNNPEALKWAQRSGCKAVFIGFESLSEEVLRERSKGFNITQLDSHHTYEEAIKRLHDHGIAIYGGFIFGNDSDDKGVFERTKKFIEKTKIDATQYSILTPLPGTKLFDQYYRDDRLLYTDFPNDWKKYDVQTPVIRPKKMSVEDLVGEVNNLYRDTSTMLPSLKRALATGMTTRHLLATFGMMFTNMAAWRQWKDFLDDFDVPAEKKEKALIGK